MVGRAGSGKTRLIRALGSDTSPTTGTVSVKVELKGRWRSRFPLPGAGEWSSKRYILGY